MSSIALMVDDDELTFQPLARANERVTNRILRKLREQQAATDNEIFEGMPKAQNENRDANNKRARRS